MAWKYGRKAREVIEAFRERERGRPVSEPPP